MPSSSYHRIPRMSLLFFVLSVCLWIQFVSFVWLNFKLRHGKPENIRGFRHDTFNTDQRNVIRSGRKINISDIKPTKLRYHEITTRAKTATTSTKLRTLPAKNNESNPTTVDMENDYYPLVNFSFVWPETTPKLQGERDFFLVVLVNSAAKGEKYRARRNAIRRTWANMTQCEQRTMLEAEPKLKSHRWILVFSLGIADDPAENAANRQESRTYNDVLIGNFRDCYLNNVVKVFMGELWVSTMNVRYILKTDDDVYVRVPSVIQWLAEQNYPKSFYGGAPYFNFKVDRNPKGKWAVSKKYFNEDIFPAFCAGAFYVLSTDLLSKLFNYVRQRRPFHTDDAYIGIAARDLNISVQRIPGLLLEDDMPKYLWNFNDCKLLQARGFGHSIEPLLMTRVFNRLDKMCEQKIKC